MIRQHEDRMRNAQKELARLEALLALPIALPLSWLRC